MLTMVSNITEQEEAVSNPLNKNKHKIQTKTAPLPLSAAKEAKSSSVDELVAKLQPYHLTIVDAATAAKYYYNQPDLQLLNPDQLANLYKRLVARAEAEASVPTPPTETPPAPEPVQVVMVESVPVVAPEEVTAKEPEATPESTTQSEEQNMSAIEQSSPIATKSLTPATEPIPVVEVLPEAPIVVVEAAAEVAPLLEAIVATAPVEASAEPDVSPASVEVAPEVVVTEAAPVLAEPVAEAPVVVAPIEVAPVVEAAPVAPVVAEVLAPVEVAAVAPAVVPVVAAPVAELVKSVPVPPAPVVAAPVAKKAPEPEVEEEEEKEPVPAPEPDIMEPRYWKKNGWSAKVIKNEDDDGWAVEISKDGLSDPVLVSPWVMGRDKKNPKPFDSPSFTTFVKTASEVMRRAAQQRERQLKKSVSSCWEGVWYKIALEITPDEYEPYATLTATNDEGEVMAKIRVSPGYKFSQAVADKWVRGGFKEQ